jgi:hypothetical protein
LPGTSLSKGVVVLVEAESVKGASEAAASDSKQLARELLEAGSTPEEAMEQTGLSRAVTLGLLGAIRKKAKKISKSEGEPSDNLGKANQEEETLVNDLRDEAKLTGAAVSLGRSQNRLRAVAPQLYDALHGGKETQAESSPSRTLIDLEVLREIKAMRAQDEGSHRNNGDSQVSGLQKQIDDLKEERHKKDLEDLKGQIAELRQDLKHSANSGSDLSVVVHEASGLLEKIVTSDGPLRSYLLPDNNIIIKSVSEAPALQGQPEARSGLNVVDVLKKRGLTTHVIQR